MIPHPHRLERNRSMRDKARSTKLSNPAHSRPVRRVTMSSFLRMKFFSASTSGLLSNIQSRTLCQSRFEGFCRFAISLVLRSISSVYSDQQSIQHTRFGDTDHIPATFSSAVSRSVASCSGTGSRLRYLPPWALDCRSQCWRACLHPLLRYRTRPTRQAYAPVW